MNFPNIYKCLLATALPIAGLALAPATAVADESPFSYVYLTEVLPPGALEIEQWATFAWDKPEEDFSQFKGRTEFEVGISNRFQVAAYLNYAHTRVVPKGPGAPNSAENEWEFESVSAEAIYQVMNPLTQPFGLAFYVEPAVGRHERELELKLLLQKNLLEDRLVLAANAILEYEWEYDHGDWERESALDFYFGAAYRVAPAWFAGGEFLTETGYEGHIFQGSEAETTAYYAGPTVHYATQNWWTTLSMLGQLPWANNHTDEADELTNGYVTGKERWRVRLRVGVPL
jgi:hypothetical protein